MRIEADTVKGTLTINAGTSETELGLYSREGFEALSELWVKVGWSLRYSYGFSWMGRPIIQLPEDLLRMQEVIYALRPDCIIETGVAYGGSLIFYASLFEAMGQGRVVGIDVEIRPKNRQAIQEHPLGGRIQLIEGESTSEKVVAEVRNLVSSQCRIMVMLDSNHTRAHVTAELECYHDLVSVGSYIVATDGIMALLHDVPGGRPEWIQDNPAEAARDFVAKHPNFVIEQPAWPFNESRLSSNITYWPGAWLRRIS